MTPDELAWVIVIFIVLLIIISLPMGCVGYYYGDDIKDRVNVFLIQIDPNKSNYQGFANVGTVRTLSNTDKYEPILKEKAAVVAVLADWCGHCVKLKQSGELDILASKVPVIVMSDLHPQAKDIMKNIKSMGFPTLALVKNGSLTLYTGERSANGILKELNVTV